MHLKGATVSPDVQALSWPLDHHTFLPVPIGDTEAPMQVVPLRNGGPAPVEYALDVSVLAGVTRANHNVEVLRLVGPPRGAIPPGRTALLNFVLQPVEAKEVVVDVPIAFSNGKVRRGEPPLPSSLSPSLRLLLLTLLPRELSAVLGFVGAVTSSDPEVLTSALPRAHPSASWAAASTLSRRQ